MRTLTVLFAGAVLVSAVMALAQSTPHTDCDRLVGNPYDLNRIDSGILAEKN